MAKKTTKKPLKPRRPLTEADKEQQRKRAAHARAVRAAKKLAEQERQDTFRGSAGRLYDAVQKANILEFAAMLGFTFEGRPGQELTLRLLHGMPLPEGKVKTFVRKPCDGFELEETEMTWFQYYRLLTGNKDWPRVGVEPTEAYLCVGRRSGKTTLTSIEALYQATRDKWRDYVRDTEKGAYAGIIATNLDQARDLMQKTCVEVLENSPLKEFIEGEVVKQSLKLKNGLGVRSFACNPRAARGYPYFFTVYDEAAWFYLEGAKADDQIDAAMNFGRAQFPNCKHMSITTPAGKQGRFYKIFSERDGDPNILRIKAPTWLFRPELETNYPGFIAREFKKDPFNANREVGAEFDEVIESFLPEKEAIESFTLAGDLPPNPYFQYGAGIDASGLAGNDRFGFSIAAYDQDRNRYVVAIVRSWEERSPNPIMAQIKNFARLYGFRTVWTDQYAKGWIHSALQGIGLEPKICPPSPVVWTNFRKFVIGHQVDLPITHSVKAAILKTKGIYNSRSNRLTIAHERDRYGHADEAEAIVRAIYGSTQDAFYNDSYSYDDAYAASRAQAEEERYDPLSYRRLG